LQKGKITHHVVQVRNKKENVDVEKYTPIRGKIDEKRHNFAGHRTMRQGSKLALFAANLRHGRKVRPCPRPLGAQGGDVFGYRRGKGKTKDPICWTRTATNFEPAAKKDLSATPWINKLVSQASQVEEKCFRS
jgi:hypothetical protein